MWSAIESVTTPVTLAAFGMACLVAVLLALLKEGPIPPIKDIPSRYRHLTADKILEIQRESAKARHRIVLFLLVILAVVLIAVLVWRAQH
ncbi:MAG TPA: hypothetical protein DIC56_23670 [Rhizobium sp.]|nr:hypothetical protein [Rhizobium sp.]